MRPVHKAAQVVPFIQTAKADSTPHTEWHSPRQINIVRNQNGLPIAHVEHESLVP